MALDQNFQQEPTNNCDSLREIPSKQNWKSSSISSTPSISSETTDGCFECNICLDSAIDPVVTFCGHLYCWPCIYKWLHSHLTDLPKCPVCKSNISNSSLVPLYGRGKTRSGSEPKLEQIIPCRPPANPQLNQNQYLLNNSVVRPSRPSSFFSPTVWIFGEMVCTMVFGNSENLFSHPDSYLTTMVGISPRIKRQEMEVEKSLNRVSIFLFCCFILCFLLF